MTPGLAAFKLAFQLSPIMFVDGIATNIPGSVLPLIAITEAAHFVSGLLSGAENIELDDFFANFWPIPGGSLVSYEAATYPLANQAVAGNAIISNGNTLSMLMHCPAKDRLGYATKLVTMIALQQVISQHAALGGTYTILTPSYFYTNAILTNLRDVSDGKSNQPQNAYQWDFYLPLITVQQAQQAQNSLMAKLSSGTQTDGSWSGLSSTVASPNSLATPSVIPSASSLPATGTTALT
jgi:hypothetical protein